jgi:murein DD-endopeptidase MepM/ murein hydrolase activator NlpD
MKKKRTDIFIYTAAAVSCVIMVLLLTTSSSISYSLYDETKPGDNSKLASLSTKSPAPPTRKMSQQQTQSATLPDFPEFKSGNVEDIISNISKPSLSGSKPVSESSTETVRELIPSKMSQAEDLTEDENEIDKLIIDILLNNQTAMNGQTKQESTDRLLDVYQTGSLPQTENSDDQDDSQRYTVKSGDCLFNIAVAHGMTLSKLIELNKITNPNLIHHGDKLIIGSGDAGTPEQKNFLVYHIQKNDTIQKIAERYKLDRQAIIRINDLTDDRVHAGQTLYLPYRLTQDLSKTAEPFKKSYRWPLLSCQISSPFGSRPDPMSPTHEISFHPGLDLTAALGDRIMAVQDGKVVFAGRKNGYGNMVVISHPDGYMSVYAHAQIIFVKAGQNVTQGQIIARVGSSGKSTGPHLHFEIRKYARTIDPRSVITASRN